MKLLTCPACEGTEFHEIRTAQYTNVRFDKQARAHHERFAYVCCGCGLTIHEHGQTVKRMNVVLTGKSAGYKRRAMINSGVEPTEWDGFSIVQDILFVEKQIWEHPSKELQKIISGAVLNVTDLSEVYKE